MTAEKLPPFQKTILINAPATAVWRALTDTALAKQWMLDEEINIITNWRVGSPIVIQGVVHWVYFENKGEVLAFEPGKILSYSHLSSLSKLRDLPENYSHITFVLEPAEHNTALRLTLSNFPTESIYKHLVFYWKTTLNILKKYTET